MQQGTFVAQHFIAFTMLENVTFFSKMIKKYLHSDSRLDIR